jgi:hypothetical protein
VNELKDEITELTEKLRFDENEIKNIEEERYNLFDLFLSAIAECLPSRIQNFVDLYFFSFEFYSSIG